MLKNILLLLLSAMYLSFPNLVKSQVILGAKEIALGQAVTALPESEWSVFANPALINSDGLGVSFFGIRYYGLPEVTDMAVSIRIPSKMGILAAGVHRYGFELFGENRLRLGYKNSYEGFHFGVVLNYSHITQGGGYGSSGALGADLGIATRLFKGMWLGGKVTNVNRPKYSNLEELSRDMSLGLSYELSEILLFTTDIVKDVRFPVSYRAGIQITLLEQLTGRVGITTEPTTFSVGIGYAGESLAVNLVAQNHQILGVSPGFDIHINW